MARRAVASASRTTMVVVKIIMTRTAPRRRTTAPATAIEFPATRTLAPDRLRIDVTGPLAYPVAFTPDVAVAIPIPEAGRPHVAVARWWQRFCTGRRRCADVDVHGNLRLGNRQHRSRRAQRYEAGEYYFFHHIEQSGGEDACKTHAGPLQFRPLHGQGPARPSAALGVLEHGLDAADGLTDARFILDQREAHIFVAVFAEADAGRDADLGLFQQDA